MNQLFNDDGTSNYIESILHNAQCVHFCKAFSYNENDKLEAHYSDHFLSEFTSSTFIPIRSIFNFS